MPPNLRSALATVSLCLAPALPLTAQMPSMSGMDMGSSPDSGMNQLMQQMHPHTFLQEIQHHATAGTSAEPKSSAISFA